MNIVKAMTVWTPRRSKLAFGLACALIAGAGWCAKRGLDRINSDFEAIYDLLYDTSPMLGWVDQRRTNTPAVGTQTTSAPALLLPTNTDVPVLQ